MSKQITAPPFTRILPDLAAFCIGIGTAWYFHWQTTDLVWSLWLSSLVLGYLTILSAIAGCLYTTAHLLSTPDFPTHYKPVTIFGGLGGSLFLLGFFSLHFCGFHSGHATFLSVFFPLAEEMEISFMNAFMNPLLLWKIVLKNIFPVYGLFLIPAAIAERKYIFAPMTKGIARVREGYSLDDARLLMNSAEEAKKHIQEPFTRPYINVIRMHLLIFFFAAAHFLRLNTFGVFTVVYAVYFFPWKAFRQTAGRVGAHPANVPETTS